MARDREDRREGRLQALVLPLEGRRIGLQKGPVGGELGLEEEGHLEDARALRETLANALLLGERIGARVGGRHGWSSGLRFDGRSCANPRRSGRQRLARRTAAARLSGGVAPLAWWLAATSRWRTTSPLRATSDQTSPLQSIQRTKRSERLRTRFASASAEARRRRGGDGVIPYFTSTFAPASSSFFFAASASAFGTASFTGFGAPSTRSLASLRPRPVSSRTALMTLTLLSPIAASTTVNSVCSSAAAGAPPAAAGAATATAAAADTPNLSSIALMSSESSRTVIDEILSRISVWTADIVDSWRNGF